MRQRPRKQRAKAAVTEGTVRAARAARSTRGRRELPPLRAFILPGGSPLGAFLHLARTVCRRAERAVVALARGASRWTRSLLAYLNRLSDLLFVLARHENHRARREERTW